MFFPFFTLLLNFQNFYNEYHFYNHKRNIYKSKSFGEITLTDQSDGKT